VDREKIFEGIVRFLLTPAYVWMWGISLFTGGEVSIEEEDERPACPDCGGLVIRQCRDCKRILTLSQVSKCGVGTQNRS
jgi:predicted RNA-binding Zn-ribbon protein involved in translation (DUF1610 family)